MYERSSPRGVPAVAGLGKLTAAPAQGCAAGRRPRSSFDQDYVRRLKEGDPATEQHFSAYFGELLLIKLRSRLRHAQAIDDVRQETFLRVLAAIKTRDRLQSPESLGAFVNAVAENVLLELYRRNSRKRTVELADHDPPDGQSSAESEMVSGERREQVRAILDSLPAKDRELLRMIFYEETDADEICKLFRVDRNYLRVLVYRAKARFRECLRKSYVEA